MKRNSVEVEKQTKGRRRIDILITWSDKKGKEQAIIIENKLNDAADQKDQLKDYYEYVVGEGYEVISLVYMPWSKSYKSYTYSNLEKKISDVAIDFDVKDIMTWL
ncbi:MAG: PD-(D/E)XK nuclease family protein, partial [Bacteroidales bacterium]